jgi:hypothetical protein
MFGIKCQIPTLFTINDFVIDNNHPDNGKGIVTQIDLMGAAHPHGVMGAAHHNKILTLQA